MVFQPTDRLDPGRLAAAVGLASGAVRADSDRQLARALLAQLGELVAASSGVLILGANPDSVVQAACGCPAGTEGRAVDATVRVLPGLLPGGVVDTIAVPLVIRDQLVGTLELGRHAGPAFSDDDRALVDLTSSRFAMLVERRRLQLAEAAARAVAADALAALRLKEERVEAMVDGVFSFIALLTPEGLVLEVNQAALQFAGVPKDAVLGTPFWDTSWWAHDAAQRQRLQGAVLAVASGQTAGFEATHVAGDGRVATVDFTLRPVRVGAVPVAYLVAEGRDITERTRAQSELTESRDSLASRVSEQAGQLAVANDSLVEMQALHAAVVQTIVDGVVVIDHRGRIEWTNGAAMRMFGYATGELVGKNVKILMPAHTGSQHDGYLARYLATGERKIIGIGREVRGARKDGSEFPLYLAVGEMQVEGVRKFTGIVRDLTETKHLEQLLQERQTLARIGELAAVVAHEVRNPLAAIRGVVEVIQTRFPAESPDRKVLGDLLLRVDSLDQLVSDLLIYARPAPAVFRTANILAVVRDTVALLANDQGARSVRFDVAGEDAQLWLDPAQMGRALLNLITNAAQASPVAGVVRITGERLADGYRLRVADEGPGMALDVAARCLEPFFTTKTRGTGLGLPIAKRVVDEHGGTFEIESVPSGGTRVTLTLPLDDPAAAK